jgi:hypothetical protein
VRWSTSFRAVERDPAVTARAYTWASRALAVVCVIAVGLGVVFIATRGPAPLVVPTAAGAVTPPATPAAPATPAPEGRASAAVTAAEAAAARSTQLGVAVLDRTTGELAVGRRGDEPYYTASEAKMVLVVDVLDRRRLDGLAVDDRSLDLVKRALSQSDDGAMNALWTRFDGPAAAARVAQRLGLKGTSNSEDVGQWGQMEVSAADTVRIWRYVLEGMPAADRDLVMTDLRAATPQGKDGFDQSFGLLDPAVRGPRATVAKQGWMCCFSGQYYLHTAGSVGADQRYLVAVLTRVPRGKGWEAARRESDGITAAVLGALG